MGSYDMTINDKFSWKRKLTKEGSIKLDHIIPKNDKNPFPSIDKNYL